MKILVISCQERVIIEPYILGREKKGMVIEKFNFLEFQKMPAIMRPFFVLIFLGPKAKTLLALWYSRP